jgi:hypothetical protein
MMKQNRSIGPLSSSSLLENDVGLLPVFLLALKLKSMRAQKEICNSEWHNNSVIDEFTSMCSKLLWQEIQDARFLETKQEAAKLTKHFFPYIKLYILE